MRTAGLVLLLAGDGGAAVRPDCHAGLRPLHLRIGGVGGGQALLLRLAGHPGVALAGLVTLVTDLAAGVTQRLPAEPQRVR